jgi:hypothetical protein
VDGKLYLWYIPVQTPLFEEDKVIAEWAMQELATANFGDARLRDRLIRMVSDLAAQPQASVPHACGDWAATQGAYDFWDSPRVTPEAIFAAHRDSTLARLAGQRQVLVIQDTTDLDLSAHPKTTGLGPLDHPRQRGLKVHSVLLASGQGVPLGLIHQQVWARDPATTGKSQQRRQLPTQAKESQRWLDALAATQAVLPPTVTTITIADREADIYDLFAAPRRPTDQLLIRATHNRRVDHEAEYLWAAIRQSPARGTLTLDIRRQDERPARQAQLTLRYLSVTIEPPSHHLQRATLPPLRLQVVLAEEEHPAADVTPICWLLLTTLPVASYDQACQVLGWYSQRWLIERYHYVLKSGCHIEQLQLETAERMARALATYCIVAWRLLWLTYEARQQPDQPCTVALETDEWHALYATIHHSTVLPEQPPTLRQAVRWIAQLGGFLGRKGDKEPGVKTIWLGLRRLNDIAATWLLLHGSLPST